MRPLTRSLAAVLAAALLAVACAKSPPPDDASADSPKADSPGAVPPQVGGAVPPQAGGEAADRAHLQRLEGEAKALARADGCSAAGQCRAAPVGAKGCGGPRYYLTFCATTTDTAALFRTLDALKRAEEDFNRKYQVGSTCDMALEPTLELAGGQCRAASR